MCPDKAQTPEKAALGQRAWQRPSPGEVTSAACGRAGASLCTAASGPPAGPPQSRAGPGVPPSSPWRRAGCGPPGRLPLQSPAPTETDTRWHQRTSPETKGPSVLPPTGTVSTFGTTEAWPVSCGPCPMSRVPWAWRAAAGVSVLTGPARPAGCIFQKPINALLCAQRCHGGPGASSWQCRGPLGGLQRVPMGPHKSLFQNKAWPRPVTHPAHRGPRSAWRCPHTPRRGGPVLSTWLCRSGAVPRPRAEG